MPIRLGISLSDEDAEMLAAIQRAIGSKEGIDVGQTAAIRKLIRDEFERRNLGKAKKKA